LTTFAKSADGQDLQQVEAFPPAVEGYGPMHVLRFTATSTEIIFQLMDTSGQEVDNRDLVLDDIRIQVVP
jgi:hypothetical protein